MESQKGRRLAVLSYFFEHCDIFEDPYRRRVLYDSLRRSICAQSVLSSGSVPRFWTG